MYVRPQGFSDRDVSNLQTTVAVLLSKPGRSPLLRGFLISREAAGGDPSACHSAGDTNVDGAIRRNGDFEVNGKDIHADSASAYGSPCKSDIGGANIDLGGSAEHCDNEYVDWPRWYAESEFTCEVNGSQFNMTGLGPSGSGTTIQLVE